MIRVLFLIWIAAQSGSQDAQQHMQAGVEALKQRHPELAIAEFRTSTELAPNSPEAFAGLGQAYMENRDYGAAIAPLKRALELNPDLLEAHQFLGFALLARGYAAEAIPHLQRAGAQDALGIAQIEAGDLPEAVENLRQALAKRPNDPDLLYYLGRASGLLSKQSIDTLLALYPDSPRAHQALAENYFVLRQMPQAEKEYQEALRQRPELPGAHLELGQVYANSARWPNAEGEFRAGAKLQPGSPEAAYRLGSALMQEGKIRDALQELQRSESLRPDMPETLYTLGKVASLSGDVALAEKSWTRLLAIEQDSSLAEQAHFGLATLYRKQGQTAKAQRELQEYQRLHNKLSPAQNLPN